MFHLSRPATLIALAGHLIQPKLVTGLVAVAGLVIAPMLPAQTDERDDDRRQCLQGLLATGADDLTLGEMRRRCAAANPEPGSNPVSGNAPPPGPVQDRLEEQRSTAPNPFTLLVHRPNYLLPAAWNERGWDPTLFRQAENDPDYTLDDIEVQFQFSVKIPLALDLFDNRVDLYAAYTNRSFWQAYNTEYSQPFRETNHEPELWAEIPNGRSYFGLTNVANRVGLVHQSNGQSEPLSRGWDRVYAELLFERGDWGFSVKPWYIINDSDDNPDIEDFMGYGELRAAWAPPGDRHVVSLMLRNQLESGFDRGAAELSWSFPFFDYPWVKGYLQYFYGYGESLIDYDRRVNRIGIGVAFSDWLD